MAADWEKTAKTFTVPDGRSGNKKDVYVGFYGRTRTVDKRTGTATDKRSAFFGLWSKKDEYVLAVQTGQGAVYRRNRKTSFNGFRTKETEYHPQQGKKSENRRYLGGLYKTGYKYDTDGEFLSTSRGDFIGMDKHSRSKDGRSLKFERDDLFGWYRKRQEALGLPDGKAVKWRTMERRVGSYSMEIIPDKTGKGETRNHSFGRLFGKNWLFERTSHYNFETGEKTTDYKSLFGLRQRGPKVRPISSAEMEKHQARTAQKAEADESWSRHSLGISRTRGRDQEKPDYSSLFDEKLQTLGSSRESNRAGLDAWLEKDVDKHDFALPEMPTGSAAGARRNDAMRRAPRTWEELESVSFGESANEDAYTSSSDPRSSATFGGGFRDLAPPPTRRDTPGRPAPSTVADASVRAVAGSPNRSGSTSTEGPLAATLRRPGPHLPQPGARARRESINFNGVTLPPDTPEHLFRQFRNSSRKTASGTGADEFAGDESDGSSTANGVARPTRQPQNSSWQAPGAKAAADSDSDASPAPRKPGNSRTSAPAIGHRRGRDRTAGADPLANPVRQSPTRLPNRSWRAPAAGAQGADSDSDSAASRPAKRLQNGRTDTGKAPAPTKDRTAVVEPFAGLSRRTPTKLQNKSWKSPATGVDGVDSDSDQGVRSREAYRKPVGKRLDDRPGDRNRSIASVDTR